MSVVTQLYFQIVEENNYIFRPFSGWAIIRLRLEYRRKLIYCNVDIKNGRTRSRFTMFGEVCGYTYAMWNLQWLQFRDSCVLSKQGFQMIVQHRMSHRKHFSLTFKNQPLFSAV
jgi:hypothetical protein